MLLMWPAGYLYPADLQILISHYSPIFKARMIKNVIPRISNNLACNQVNIL